MKLKEYIKVLQGLAKMNDENGRPYSDRPLVYGCDDEGNAYRYVFFSPSPHSLYIDGDFEEKQDVICIN